MTQGLTKVAPAVSRQCCDIKGSKTVGCLKRTHRVPLQSESGEDPPECHEAFIGRPVSGFLCCKKPQKSHACIYPV